MTSLESLRRARCVLRAAAVGAGLALAGAAQAVPVSTVGDVSVWNVGNGQANGDFQVVTDAAFTGGALQLGIRATERKVGNTTPDGNVYRYAVGPSAGTAPSDPNRARWNFDFHVDYAGIVADLDGLTLAISSSNPTNVPTVPVVDLLDAGVRAAVDCHSTGTACASATPPAGALSSGPHTGDPDRLYQASQNPVFGWFTPTFDFNVPGTYTFTLTATEGNTTIATTMQVAVAAPATVGMLLLGLGAAAGVRRRKS